MRLPEALEAARDGRPVPDDAGRRSSPTCTTSSGDLIAALDRTQRTAITLASEQGRVRRQAGEMFADLGRRHQSLLGRTLALVAELEIEPGRPRDHRRPAAPRPPRHPHAPQRGEPARARGFRARPRLGRRPPARRGRCGIALGEIEAFDRVDVGGLEPERRRRARGRRRRRTCSPNCSRTRPCSRRPRAGSSSTACTGPTATSSRSSITASASSAEDLADAEHPADAVPHRRVHPAAPPRPRGRRRTGAPSRHRRAALRRRRWGHDRERPVAAGAARRGRRPHAPAARRSTRARPRAAAAPGAGAPRPPSRSGAGRRGRRRQSPGPPPVGLDHRACRGCDDAGPLPRRVPGEHIPDLGPHRDDVEPPVATLDVAAQLTGFQDGVEPAADEPVDGRGAGNRSSTSPSTSNADDSTTGTRGAAVPRTPLRAARTCPTPARRATRPPPRRCARADDVRNALTSFQHGAGARHART